MRKTIEYHEMEDTVNGCGREVVDIDCVWEGKALKVFIVERFGGARDIIPKAGNEVELHGKTPDTLLDMAEAAANVHRNDFFLDLDAEFRYK